jgi:hypothetical protein
MCNIHEVGYLFSYPSLTFNEAIPLLFTVHIYTAAHAGKWPVTLLTYDLQNSLLGKLLGFQQQMALATRLQAEWAQPMTNYLGRIAWALEA